MFFLYQTCVLKSWHVGIGALRWVWIRTLEICSSEFQLSRHGRCYAEVEKKKEIPFPQDWKNGHLLSRGTGLVEKAGAVGRVHSFQVLGFGSSSAHFEPGLLLDFHGRLLLMREREREMRDVENELLICTFSYSRKYIMRIYIRFYSV